MQPNAPRPSKAYLDAIRLGQSARTAHASKARSTGPPVARDKHKGILQSASGTGPADDSADGLAPSTAKGAHLCAELQKMLASCTEKKVEPPTKLAEMLSDFLNAEASAAFEALEPQLALHAEALLAEHGVSETAMRTRSLSLKQHLYNIRRRTELHPTYSNVLGNVLFHPLRVVPVYSFHDVVNVYSEALAAGTTVKPVGSGHSYSLNQQTDGFVIDTSGRLSAVASASAPITGQLHGSLLRQPTHEINGVERDWLQIDGAPLVYPKGTYDPALVDGNKAYFEAEGGITVDELVHKLEQNNLGLINMGGAAWQTLAGYCSTSTHGSGVALGPVCDSIQSLVIVTTGEWPSGNLTVPARSSAAAGVFAYRIERASGITCPAKYAASAARENVGLIQDDKAFAAACCSFGAFGTIYSIVLEVQQFYWLEQFAVVAPWNVLTSPAEDNLGKEGAGLMAPGQGSSDQFPDGWLSPGVKDGAVVPMQRGQQMLWCPYPARPYAAFGMTAEQRAEEPHLALYAHNRACEPVPFGPTPSQPTTARDGAGSPPQDVALSMRALGRQHGFAVHSFVWSCIEKTAMSAIGESGAAGPTSRGVGSAPPKCLARCLAAGKRLLNEIEFAILAKIQTLQVVYDLVALLEFALPELSPYLSNAALHTQATMFNKRGKYYDVFLLGTSENAGFASEYAFPLEVYAPSADKRRSKSREAGAEGSDPRGPYKIWPSAAQDGGKYDLTHLNTGMRIITESAYSIWRYGRTDGPIKRGGHFLTSPMGVRPVAASDKALSMMFGCRTVMLELDMAHGTFAGFATLRTLGFRLNAAGCRFHWGLNFDAGQANRRQIEQAYPQIEMWKQVAAVFNRKGTHTNSFLCSLLGLQTYPALF